jgi:glycopeptide antibiotics resistance protein
MIWIISYALQNFINPYVVVPGMLVLIVLLWRWRKKRSVGYRVFFGLFWIYLLMLFSMTVFSGTVYRSLTWDERLEMAPLLLARVNLAPFHFGQFAYAGYIFTDVILNILVTVPLGFGLAFLTPLRARTMLIIAVGVGVFFETGQLAASLLAALPLRVTDINDAIFNALGVMVGYGVFGLFRHWAERAILHKSIGD